MVYCYTTLMDRSPNAFWLEIIKTIFGIGIYLKIGNWFGLDQICNGGSYFMLSYLIGSIFIVGYFVFFEMKTKE
jgi:hypothetical protein